MEFKFRDVDDRPPTYYFPSSVSEPGHLPDLSLLGAGYPSRPDSILWPTNVHEATQREIEKQQIRQEIIAAEQRRYVLEAEVRRELMMEREIAWRRAEAVTMQLDRRIPFIPQYGVGFPVDERMALARGSMFDLRPSSQLRKPVAVVRGINSASMVNTDKVIMLAKPGQNLAGTKSKVLSPPVAGSGYLPFAAGLEKKPREELSCALCQVSSITERGLNEHLQGKKHKNKVAALMKHNVGAALGAQQMGKKSSASCMPKGSEKPSELEETIEKVMVEPLLLGSEKPSELKETIEKVMVEPLLPGLKSSTSWMPKESEKPSELKETIEKVMVEPLLPGLKSSTSWMPKESEKPSELKETIEKVMVEPLLPGKKSSTSWMPKGIEKASELKETIEKVVVEPLLPGKKCSTSWMPKGSEKPSELKETMEKIVVEPLLPGKKCSTSWMPKGSEMPSELKETMEKIVVEPLLPGKKCSTSWMPKGSEKPSELKETMEKVVVEPLLPGKKCSTSWMPKGSEKPSELKETMEKVLVEPLLPGKKCSTSWMPKGIEKPSELKETIEKAIVEQLLHIKINHPEEEAVKAEKKNTNANASGRNNVAATRPKEETGELGRKKHEFWCEICQIGTDSEKVMGDHKNGKKHKNRLLGLGGNTVAVPIGKTAEQSQKVTNADLVTE